MQKTTIDSEKVVDNKSNQNIQKLLEKLKTKTIYKYRVKDLKYKRYQNEIKKKRIIRAKKYLNYLKNDEDFHDPLYSNRDKD